MKSFFLSFTCCAYMVAAAQVHTSVTDIAIRNKNVIDTIAPVKKSTVNSVSLKNFIAPAILSGYGALALESGELKKVNVSAKDEILRHFPSFKSSYDNYAQYAPAVAVFALQAFKVKGANSVKDEVFICLLTTAVTTAVVTPVKHWTHELRPDNSNYLSFPSGHTATAFASAEFLRREYKDVSPWIGVAGYVVATSTGVFRMLNQKHWLSDVAAGAGIGIASANAAYWLYPKIKKIFAKNKSINTMLMPLYQEGSVGIGLVHFF